MLDAMVAMTDIVTNFWSLGVRRAASLGPLICDGFRASDGWFVVQVVREHQFERARRARRPSRVARRPALRRRAQGWVDHLEDVHPPGDRGVGRATRPSSRRAEALTAAGIAAGPCTPTTR